MNNQYNTEMLRYFCQEWNECGLGEIKPEPRSGSGQLEKSDFAGKKLKIAKDVFLFIEAKEHAKPSVDAWYKKARKATNPFEDVAVIWKKPHEKNHETKITMDLTCFFQILHSFKNAKKDSV